MKLFLSSLSISAATLPAFESLVGKKVEDIRMALCENAADVYPESGKGFVYETRENLMTLGLQISHFDLHAYRDRPSELADFLQKFDVVWFGGGNTYYLRQCMRESGFDAIVSKLVQGGLVYGGGSAGAIVACVDLHHYDKLDAPEAAAETIYDGLGLLEQALIPHWGTVSIEAELQAIKNSFTQEGKRVVCLTDEEALIVDAAGAHRLLR